MALESILGMMDMLPQILSMIQLVAYLFLTWFFGTIAFRGMHKRLPFIIRIVSMLAAGFLCLIAGAAFRGYIFFLQGDLMEIVQLDLFIGGILSSVVLALGLHAITRKEREGSKDDIIKKLRGRIDLLKGLLIKEKVPTIEESKIKKTAEGLVPGFTAEKTTLRDSDWEVTLENEEKRAIAVIDAYTGEVKKIEHLGAMGKILSDPLRIVGAAVIIGLLALTLLNFQGLPNMFEGVASLLGMSTEQFNSIMGSDEGLPSGCVSAMKIAMSQGVSVMGGENSYTNEDVKRMIESETGRVVMLMYQTEYQGSDYILSITLPSEMEFTGLSNEAIMQNAEICSSTEEILCDCVKLPDLNFPTGFIIAR